MSDPPKVLYILGKGRSGSTLLDIVLGQAPGFFSTGELHRIWDWGVDQGVLCGCGVGVADCTVWSRVLWSIDLDPEAARRLERRALRWRHAPRLLLAGGGAAEDVAAFARMSSSLYRRLAEVTGARVIVDSSKIPFHPAAVGLVPGVESFAVQLVRDPRAVAHSWRRRKVFTDRAGAEEMPRFSPVFSAGSWLARNTAAERARTRLGAAHSLLVRYEDFAAQPRETLQMLQRLVGEDPDTGFLEGRRVRTGTTHTVGGNPDRMRSGQLEIREDVAWQGDVGRGTWGVVTALTLPRLGRYGYPVRRS